MGFVKQTRNESHSSSKANYALERSHLNIYPSVVSWPFVHHLDWLSCFFCCFATWHNTRFDYRPKPLQRKQLFKVLPQSVVNERTNKRVGVVIPIPAARVPALSYNISYYLAPVLCPAASVISTSGIPSQATTSSCPTYLRPAAQQHDIGVRRSTVAPVVSATDHY